MDKPYEIVSLELGPMENFVYLIKDKKTARCAVVDPAWQVDEILEQAQRMGCNISDILLTHSHNDHINGVGQVLARYDAQLHLLKPEAEFWGQQLDLPTLHHGGDRIMLGETEIQVLHTPGHTPGSACYHLGDDLITGDTMFVFGCGRCDLSGGDPEVMYQTLTRMSRELPGETRILPGHNYSVTPTSCIRDEIEGNPFLHFDNAADFVEYRMHTHDKIRHSPYHPVLDHK